MGLVKSSARTVGGCAAAGVAAVECFQAFEDRLHNITLCVLLLRGVVAQALPVPPPAATAPWRDDGANTLLVEPLVQRLAIIAFISKEGERRSGSPGEQAANIAHVVRWAHPDARG